MAIVFVCVTVFLVGFRLLAMLAFPTLAVGAWLIVRRHPDISTLGLSLNQKSYYDPRNIEQLKHTPWFAKAGAACSIVPIARFVGPNIFALKGGGYGCLFAHTGIDEEGLTDQELESLRGVPEGSCLYQYTRAMSDFDHPRQAKSVNPATEVFANDRFTFLRTPRASAVSTCTSVSRWSRRR